MSHTASDGAKWELSFGVRCEADCCRVSRTKLFLIKTLAAERGLPTELSHAIVYLVELIDVLLVPLRVAKYMALLTDRLLFGRVRDTAIKRLDELSEHNTVYQHHLTKVSMQAPSVDTHPEQNRTAIAVLDPVDVKALQKCRDDAVCVMETAAPQMAELTQLIRSHFFATHAQNMKLTVADGFDCVPDFLLLHMIFVMNREDTDLPLGIQDHHHFDVRLSERGRHALVTFCNLVARSHRPTLLWSESFIQ